MWDMCYGSRMPDWDDIGAYLFLALLLAVLAWWRYEDWMRLVN